MKADYCIIILTLYNTGYVFSFLFYNSITNRLLEVLKTWYKRESEAVDAKDIKLEKKLQLNQLKHETIPHNTFYFYLYMYYNIE